MMEYIKNNEKRIIVFFLSIFLVFSINLNFDKENFLLKSFSGNNVLCLIELFIINYLLNKGFEIKEKRLIIIGVIVGIIFSIFEVIGFTIFNYQDLSLPFQTNHYFIKLIIKFFSYAIIFYSVVVIVYSWINKRLQSNDNDTQCEQIEDIKRIKSKNIKCFFINMGLIFISYIPYLLQYYPGILTYDSAHGIGQALGMIELSDAHPLIYVFIVYISMEIGKLFGNYNVGVATYSVIQMLFMSGVFSFVLIYLKNKGLPKILVLTLFVFFAFYPCNGVLSITMWKDIPFSLSIVLLTICMIEFVTNAESFILSKRKNMFLILSILSVMLLRHNGFYACILLIPFLIIFGKKYYKKVLIVCGIVLFTIILYRVVIFNIAKIQKGNSVETISILVQQVARTVKYKGDSLTTDDKENISKFFDINRVGQLYDPLISDPVKGNFNNKYYDQNKTEFYKLWFSLLLKYPTDYVEAFLCNNQGYWYPEAKNFIVIKGFSSPEHPVLQELNITSNGLIDSKIVTNYDSLMERRDIPVISFAFSIGFQVWVMILCVVYEIYRKKYMNILIYLPVIFVWLTILASPVFCEYRYMYFVFICVPIYIMNICLNKNRVN